MKLYTVYYYRIIDSNIVILIVISLLYFVEKEEIENQIPEKKIVQVPKTIKNTVKCLQVQENRLSNT